MSRWGGSWASEGHTRGQLAAASSPHSLVTPQHSKHSLGPQLGQLTFMMEAAAVKMVGRDDALHIITCTGKSQHSTAGPGRGT